MFSCSIYSNELRETRSIFRRVSVLSRKKFPKKNEKNERERESEREEKLSAWTESKVKLQFPNAFHLVDCSYVFMFEQNVAFYIHSSQNGKQEGKKTLTC